MKIIYLAFLLVVGSFFQSGNTQTVSSGGGKLVGNSNELLSGKSESNGTECVALAARESKTNPEKGSCMADPTSAMTKSTETDPQLDSITMQMADVAMIHVEEQADISLQDSVATFIKTNAAQDHDIMAAISASRRDAHLDSSVAYLGQPTPDYILEILAPGLLADRESFAHDVIKALLDYNVTLDAARRQAAK
jgi:hypothetical protein